jgi:hypothetical protein
VTPVTDVESLTTADITRAAGGRVGDLIPAPARSIERTIALRQTTCA